MTDILSQLKWESLKKRIKDNRLILQYIKVGQVKPEYLQVTLSPRLGAAEINIPWYFKYPLLV